MIDSHYLALAAGYAVAALSWLAVARMLPRVWPPTPAIHFAHPWREVGWALLAVLAVVGLGQLWGAGWRLPEQGNLGILFESINQLVIFSPLLLLLWLRRQPPSTAWIPTDRVATRVLVGLVLATLAFLAFTLVSRDAPWLALLGRISRPRNAPFAVKVLLYDLGSAILFVRLRAALGLRLSILLVAALFAAAHVPALLQQGATPGELARLVLDAGLGVGILSVVQRSADIWWFWPVHFALAVTQFWTQFSEAVRDAA
ncbi:MAG TPA: hypothetical protein VHR45_07685 [Thermoanaerobaculia bacterium]|nr:hypothetical protein [Thermoanaerobaculia bacterium]